jgi:flagellar motor switch protein FliN
VNEAAAKVIVEALLRGAFDTFDAMLAQTFSYEAEAPRPAGEETLNDWLSEYPVALSSSVERDTGAAVMLLHVEDAARMAALMSGGDAEDKASLNDDDRAMLQEIGGAALGGGLARVMEVCGEPPHAIESTQFSDAGPGAGEALRALLGGGSAGASFTFRSAEGFNGEGVLLWNGRLESLSKSGVSSEDSILSSEEVGDILSGFDSARFEPAMESSRLAPENLDLILDIRLVATARLGNIDVPLRDVLHYGPGSIIELDKLVDEPVDLMVNDKLIARGDVVVVDEKFGIRITEIVSPRKRIESLR